MVAVLRNDDDDAVDPHLEQIRNAAGRDESDKEVSFLGGYLNLSVFIFPRAFGFFFNM